MGLPVTAILDLANLTLEAVVNRWPAEAEPLPTTRYVSNGLVVWDCESLVVMVESTFGTDGDVAAEAYVTQAALGFPIRAAIVGVLLLRCAPDLDDNGNPPPVSEITTSAETILTDAIAVFNTLVDAQIAGQLGICSGLAFERWTSEGPASGLAGGMLRYRALML